MQWKILSTQIKMITSPFSVEEVLLEDKIKNKNYKYYRLQSPDWVNICPIDEDGNFILIEQSRIGANEDILEVPGGVVESSESPYDALQRELEEETGLYANKIVYLRSINPNPAIMTNKLHMFLALGCQLKSTRTRFPDPNEYIKVNKYSLEEIKNIIEQNKIGSALALLTVLLALDYIDKNNLQLSNYKV